MDALNVVLIQIAHRFLLPDLFDGLDDQHLPFRLRAFVVVCDQQTGRHGCVVKEVGAKAYHAFYKVLFHHLPAHVRLLIPEQNTMRPKRDGTTVFDIRTLLDVLLEGVVRASLRRDAPNVSAVGVVGEGLLVPGLDGIWRVGEDDVELLQLVVFEEGGIGQGVAPNDLEFLNAVHEHVHSRNGRGDHVDLLPIELQGAVLLALVLEVKCAVEEQAA